MINLIISAILGIFSLGIGLNSIPTNTIQNSITVQSISENVTNIQWYNNMSKPSNNEKTWKYDIDTNEASKSMDVYIQEEYVPFDEIIPTDCFIFMSSRYSIVA